VLTDRHVKLPAIAEALERYDHMWHTCIRLGGVVI
jgi:hypothetical protein